MSLLLSWFSSNELHIQVKNDQGLSRFFAPNFVMSERRRGRRRRRRKLFFFFFFFNRGGDVAQLLESRTGTPPRQVRIPGAARDFSPRVNLQCQLSYGVRTTLCAIACIYICAHEKDPVVHVRVRWIMETLKHPACTVGWVARLCRRWLSPGKATRIFHGRNPIGTIQ